MRNSSLPPRNSMPRPLRHASLIPGLAIRSTPMSRHYRPTSLAALFFTLVMLGLTTSFSSASAQITATGGLRAGEISVGISTALTSNRHHGGTWIWGVDDSCSCRSPRDARMNGYQVGVAVRHRLSDVLSFDGRAVYDSRPTLFEQEMPGALVLLPGTNEVVNQETRAYSDVTYDLFTTDAMFTASLELVNGFSIAASVGPSVGVVKTARYTTWQDLITPEDARFTNPQGLESENKGRRLYLARNREIEDAASVRLSAKVGGGIEIEPLRLGTIRIGAYYDHPLTTVTTTDDWRISSLIYQLDLLVRL